MNILLTLFKTIYKLGLFNVLYVIWYRVSLYTGVRKYLFPISKDKFSNDLFMPDDDSNSRANYWDTSLIQEADKLIGGHVNYFVRHSKNVGSPPNWFLNPFNGIQYKNVEQHWTSLPDFDPTFGDIKNIWELSRFAWVPTLARAYAVSGKKAYIDTTNRWLSDWIEKNPFNQGPHWKCGQEASIRVFNLLNASLILGSTQNPESSLSDIVYLHLGRISSNIKYAIAQNNNHGTSEATALFIGGNWLSSVDPTRYPRAKYFALKGRKWLENRITKLIAEDGGFSQYSINYHRVLIDTLIFVEVWRRKLNLVKFSELFYSRVNAAIHWLEIFIDPDSGDAPNLGANDGSLLLNMHSCGYRDFRPTVQTANAIFNNIRTYPPGLWDEPSQWLKISFPENLENKVQVESELMDSGYVFLKDTLSWGMIRFPKFKFRPSHNDVFHLDLWYQGHNILFDSGTYSYNQSVGEQKINLKSVHCHNTVAFNRDEQMPELSRFLLGDWLKPDFVSKITHTDQGQQWVGQYTTSKGYRHQRRVSIKQGAWQIEDDLGGDFSSAIIGFNVMLGEYSIDENTIVTDWGAILIPKNTKYEIVTSSASLYYQERHTVSRIEIMISEAGCYMTKFAFAK